MMKCNFLIIGLALFLGTTVFAQEKQELSKSFAGKESIRIETTSGDCILKQGTSDNIDIHVVWSVRPEDAFEPDIQERDNSLRIKERWYGRSSGRVTWTISVPAATDIRFSTASGDLSISDLKNRSDISTASGEVTIENSEGTFDISTASGDVTLLDLKGEFDVSTASGEVDANNLDGEIKMNTASGDVKVRKSSGAFELSCASGEIQVSNIVIKEESSFSTASGDIDVTLGESAEYDLELSAASGDVTLDYAGNEIKGFFEFQSKKRRGRIKAPFDFDTEEEHGRHDDIYVIKTARIKADQPRIFLKTSSGKAVLRK
jgi:DUF4097 and DUF4098 domain-containing protein YvlB